MILNEKTKESRKKRYDGQMQYAIAKRGQVILAELLARKYSQEYSQAGSGTSEAGSGTSGCNVRVVSCHPGWCDTPGVRGVYSESTRKWLEPLRSLREGVEGICWLLAAGCQPAGSQAAEKTDNHVIENGEFYLDCEKQEKFVSGWLSSGKSSLNTEEEKAEFYKGLVKLYEAESGGGGDGGGDGDGGSQGDAGASGQGGS
jgi:hypothetical protein